MKKICSIMLPLSLGIYLSNTTTLNAAIQWLPDALEKGLKFDGYKFPSGGRDSDSGRGLDCNGYGFDKCPDHASCSRCPYGDKYRITGCDSGYRQEGQSCVCVPDACTGFDLTSAPANAEYTSCEPGCGQSTKYKKTGCKQGAYLENGQCVKCTKTQTSSSCPAGKTIDTTTSCENENGVTVGDCVDCLSEKGICNGYKLCGDDEVTVGASCGCGGKTYYKDCQPCDKTQNSCPTGQTLVNTCQKKSGTYGDCVDCRDENSPYNPCKGYHICEGNKEPSGKSCQCGSQMYYETCLVVETCKYSYRPSTAVENCPDGIWDRSNEKCGHRTYFNNSRVGNTSAGYLSANGKTCVSDVDGKTYWDGPTACNYDYGKNNDAPCAGFKSAAYCKATGGFKTTSEHCSCGGEDFYMECLDSCNYSYRKSTPTENCPDGIWDRSKEKCGNSIYFNNSRVGNTSAAYLSANGKTCVSDVDGKTYWDSPTACNYDYGTNNDAPCAGFKSAAYCKATGGFKTTSEHCSCGGEDFYMECLDSCNYSYRPSTPEENCPDGIWNRSKEKCGNDVYFNNSSVGHTSAAYLSANGETCVSDVDGKTYWKYTTACNKDYGKNNDAPCAGFLSKEYCKASGGLVGGTLCHCGGETFGSVCLAKCESEETPESCSAKGKGFTMKCMDGDGKQFGECK